MQDERWNNVLHLEYIEWDRRSCLIFITFSIYENIVWDYYMFIGNLVPRVSFPFLLRNPGDEVDLSVIICDQLVLLGYMATGTFIHYYYINFSFRYAIIISLILSSPIIGDICKSYRGHSSICSYFVSNNWGFSQYMGTIGLTHQYLGKVSY